MKWRASIVAADSNTLPAAVIPAHGFFLPPRRLFAVDSRKLKYFLAVVDHDGFNRAASTC
jgi:hypothetical protein